jgi:hypothetical protein
LHGLAEAAVLVVGADDRPAAFPEARERIRAAVACHPQFAKDRELWRAYRRCLAVIGGSGVGLGGRLWCLAQRV